MSIKAINVNRVVQQRVKRVSRRTVRLRPVGTTTDQAEGHGHPSDGCQSGVFPTDRPSDGCCSTPLVTLGPDSCLSVFLQVCVKAWKLRSHINEPLSWQPLWQMCLQFHMHHGSKIYWIMKQIGEGGEGHLLGGSLKSEIRSISQSFLNLTSISRYFPGSN